MISYYSKLGKSRFNFQQSSRHFILVFRNSPRSDSIYHFYYLLVLFIILSDFGFPLQLQILKQGKEQSNFSKVKIDIYSLASTKRTQQQIFQLIIIIKLKSLMSQIKYDSHKLTAMIESIQGKIISLMQQEMKEKVEQQKLLDSIRMLEGKSNSKSSVKNKLSQQHRLNMKYFDQKISNHEDTFVKFKNLYQSLQAKKHLNYNSFMSKDGQSKNGVKNSNGCAKIQKMSNLEESGITTRSMAYQQQHSQWAKINESINVVCEMECQTCGQNFKPYSYYQHLQNCQNQIIPAQMCTSMLV